MSSTRRSPMSEARPGRAGMVAAVAAGGALGTMARYELALAEPVASGRFPWATFSANVLGALLVGVFLAALVDSWVPARYVRPFAVVGFCGGLTTFSTWMVESVLLVRDGAAATAVLYLVASVLTGAVGVALGVFATRRAFHRRDALTFDPRDED